MFTLSMVHRTIGTKILTLLTAVALVGCSSSSASNSATATVTATEISIIPSPTAAPTIEPGDSEHTINIDGKDRVYLLHIPPGLAESAPAPLVIMLHGYSTGVSYIRSTSKLDDEADVNGFIVAYPKGMGASWNSGGCCSLAAQEQVDDVGFVRQLILDLDVSFNLDTKRIYVVGYNVGGMMAYRLGCEMADTFAAIASVSGVLLFDQCQPVNAVALLHIHGLSDSAFPYLGGESDCDLCGGIPTLPPVETGIQMWAKWDSCTGSLLTNKEGSITHTIYSDCQLNTAVELYTIEGMEYSWPVPSGTGTSNFPATQTIWDFFAAHPKP